MDLPSNNLQRLICHKAQPTNLICIKMDLALNNLQRLIKPKQTMKQTNIKKNNEKSDIKQDDANKNAVSHRDQNKVVFVA